jgi:hypothetical protein
MPCRPLEEAGPAAGHQAPAHNPRPAPVAAGTHHPEAEVAAGNHHPEAEEEADIHRVEAEEAGSYQGAVAVDRSWTPSSVKLAGNERAYPILRGC